MLNAFALRVDIDVESLWRPGFEYVKYCHINFINILPQIQRIGKYLESRFLTNKHFEDIRQDSLTQEVRMFGKNSPGIF